MDALTFLSLADANAAVAAIDLEMGMAIVGRNQNTGELEPSKATTITWAIVDEVAGQAKWWIPKPKDEHMTAVIGHTVETYDSSWYGG